MYCPNCGKEIIENSRTLARDRKEVENDIRAKMGTSRIFIKPKAFESVRKEKK